MDAACKVSISRSRMFMFSSPSGQPHGISLTWKRLEHKDWIEAIRNAGNIVELECIKIIQSALW